MVNQGPPHPVHQVDEGVLILMSLQPDREWYRSEFAHALGLGPSSLQLPLARLIGAGIVSDRYASFKTFYRLNRADPAYLDLQPAIARTAAVVRFWKDALPAYGEKITVAFLYGWFTGGEDIPNRDVGLFVVGEADPEELAQRSREPTARLGREVVPNVVSDEEFARRSRQRDPVLRDMIARPKLFVHGTVKELRNAALIAKGRLRP